MVQRGEVLEVSKRALLHIDYREIAAIPSRLLQMLLTSSAEGTRLLRLGLEIAFLVQRLKAQEVKMRSQSLCEPRFVRPKATLYTHSPLV